MVKGRIFGQTGENTKGSMRTTRNLEKEQWNGSKKRSSMKGNGGTISSMGTELRLSKERLPNEVYLKRGN